MRTREVCAAYWAVGPAAPEVITMTTKYIDCEGCNEPVDTSDVNIVSHMGIGTMLCDKCEEAFTKQHEEKKEVVA